MTGRNHEVLSKRRMPATHQAGQTDRFPRSRPRSSLSIKPGGGRLERSWGLIAVGTKKRVFAPMSERYLSPWVSVSEVGSRIKWVARRRTSSMHRTVSKRVLYDG